MIDLLEVAKTVNPIKVSHKSAMLLLPDVVRI